MKHPLTCLLVCFFSLAFLAAASAAAGKSPVPPLPEAVTDSAPGAGATEFGVRQLRYHPEGSDFVITNGTRRYNRALYGTHTAFRIEGGDLPEFALYIPGIAGDMKLGVLTAAGSKWLNDFDTVEARYRPGTLLYRLKDRTLGDAVIRLQLLALPEGEGLILKAVSAGNTQPVRLVCVYGGASGMHPSRNGDLGADPPSVFFLTPRHARGNRIRIDKNRFRLLFRDRKRTDTISGMLPQGASLHTGSAARLGSPAGAVNAGTDSLAPVLVAVIPLQQHQAEYVVVRHGDSLASVEKTDSLFRAAAACRRRLASRVEVGTPDPFLNTLGADLSVAGDAIWQRPAYLHGAVAWRMWLNGWRGVYTADPLGWHDRAQTEFSAYNKMQLTAPDTTIHAPDPAYGLARQKESFGLGIYNSGYITRYPQGKKVLNHYDMNLAYMDALLRHFLWTDDTALLRSSWPVIQRHLAWEKRNFDADGNGLFDAYACIWASDALQYSGGDVCYSSAFNYFDNRMASRLAVALGKDPSPFRREARRIRSAMDSILWMPERGWYAEYRDKAGMVHPDAGVWSIYHAIDAGIADPFQAWQALRYIDTRIPHIPIRCPALKGHYQMLSTTDWMPYTWSVNNVAMAEMVHTALAFWEGGRPEEAFHLFKSVILESMYLGPSPGNFEQLSYYDRYRGELYRDFADPIGISARALVEGLFGILPDALSDTLTVKPGFPAAWDHASIRLPDIGYRYRSKGDSSVYRIRPAFAKRMALKLVLRAPSAIQDATVNGRPVAWHDATGAVGGPQLVLAVPPAAEYAVRIRWTHHRHSRPEYDSVAVRGAQFRVRTGGAQILDVRDPQHTLSDIRYRSSSPTRSGNNLLTSRVAGREGPHTLFLRVREDSMTWWMAADFTIRPGIQVVAADPEDSSGIRFRIRNNTGAALSGKAVVSAGGFRTKARLSIAPGKSSAPLFVPAAWLLPGSNPVSVTLDGYRADTVLTAWNLPGRGKRYRMISLDTCFNDRVTSIFRNRYLSPRPAKATLQQPVQGIGNWCTTGAHPLIADSGLRALAGSRGYFRLPDGIPFKTPSAARAKNIIFTSLWDNYPDSVRIPLTGRASHAWLLMAGSTNPMQSRILNAEVVVRYADGSRDVLPLKNPGTWWPVAQDYSYDGYAFHCASPVPWRVHLKTGLITRHFRGYKAIRGLTDLGVPGGAATVYDLPLDAGKELVSLELKTVAPEVVAGLMSVTLLNKK